MTDVVNRLHMLVRGGQVRRFHTIDTIKDNSVAEHSYHVALLCWLLTIGQPSTDLLLAALMHDIPEFVTGDIPANTKRDLGLCEKCEELEAGILRSMLEGLEHYRLTGPERRVLQLADCMAGMLQCVRERMLGNRNVEGAYNNWTEYVRELKPVRHEYDVLDAISGMWRDAGGSR
jgi:5'-deoxynucleotidase YfbR-like HD superfamily hydrolase